MEQKKSEDSLSVELVKGSDICRLLKISERTLNEYRESGLIPYLKLNARVFRYDAGAVRGAVERLRVN